MRRIEDEGDLASALAALSAQEPRFDRILARTGSPPLRRLAPGFPGLMRMLVGQQISTRSASAIWERLAAEGLGSEKAVLAAGEPGLRAAGLTRQKARYAVIWAEAVADGSLDLSEVHALSERAPAVAAARLTALTGLGPWTADAYLMICCGAPDVFPAGDLALQIAAGEVFGDGARLTAPQAAAMAEAWSPFRAAAARALWAHYQAATGRSGQPA